MEGEKERMNLTNKMFGLEPAKTIWTENKRSWVRIRRGYLVLLKSERTPVLIKETVYGPYVRVAYWPFLGYGKWIESERVRQIIEPTYWSVAANALRRMFRCKAEVFKA